MDVHPALVGKYLYFGNLTPGERQYDSGKFVGLALTPQHRREIRQDAYEPLPVESNSVKKIQSQDVFEHLEYDRIPPVLDEIYRVLEPGGQFRLSLPDYRSPFLLPRCVFDERGNVLADLRMGGSVVFDRATKKRRVEFKPDGGAHLWFPTFELVKALIQRSAIKGCSEIRFRHYFKDKDTFVSEDIPEDEMFVMRTPPNDMRAGGKPISIVVDFYK